MDTKKWKFKKAMSNEKGTRNWRRKKSICYCLFSYNNWCESLKAILIFWGKMMKSIALSLEKNQSNYLASRELVTMMRSAWIKPPKPSFTPLDVERHMTLEWFTP